MAPLVKTSLEHLRIESWRGLGAESQLAAALPQQLAHVTHLKCAHHSSNKEEMALPLDACPMTFVYCVSSAQKYLG